MPQTTFTIGRDPTANLFIQDPSISRFHAAATLHENGALLVEDTQSSNGTFLVRQGVETRIQQEWVTTADTVKFGSFPMRVAELLALFGPVAAAPPKSVRLIRCSCGAVKTSGLACPACRQ